MKKLLLPFLLFLGFTLVSGVLFGQAPVLNYNGAPGAQTISVAANSAVTPISPNTTNTVGTYGAPTNFATPANGGTAGAIYYDGIISAFYGAEYSFGALDKITLAGASSTINGSATFPGNDGYCIVTDAAGTVYFNNAAGNTKILEFATGSTAVARTITASTTPKGLAIDASNNLYVVDAVGGTNGAGKIVKYALGATTGTTIISGLNNPSGIAILGNDIYVAEYGTTIGLQGIFKIAGGVTGSTTVTPFVAETTVSSLPFKTPNNLTFDANGNLFVADGGNARIDRITPAGVLTSPITGLTTPYQVTFDPSGNLYIGDLNTSWRKCVGTYYAVTSGTLPAGLVLNPVTGVISGTPTATGTNPVVITATNATGPGTQSLTFNLTYPPATVTYTGSPYAFTVGTPITTVTPTSTNSATSFAISPSLNTNTGLTFSTTTGAISGTPTIATGAITYTVTPSNAGGAGTPSTISVQVYPIKPTIAYTGSPFTYPVGAAITTLSPSTNTGSPTSYTISPNLNTNTGLTFNTTNGQISGTPTIASAATVYTISAYNANPTPGTAMISIATVNPPTVTYTGSPYTFTVGSPITTVTPGTTNSPTSFAISPNLNTNTGLTFSTTSGAISGTPTTVSPATTYTITPSNAAGAGTPTTISVQVYPASPTIAYTGSPFTYGVGVAITTLAPSTNTGSPTSYAITPNLATNTGLTFNTTNGQISGTPTTASTAVTYTISAYNANPTPGTTMISITVVSPPTVTYTGSPYTYTVGTANATVTPTSTNSPTSYAISPNLTTNTGLVFSTSTGAISGAPTAAYPATNYTVTPTNQAGAGTPATISIVVYPVKPTIAYTGSPFTYGVGVAITTLTPTVTGSPTSYSITPSLATNTGLTFSTVNGQISGTPTTASAAVTYTISAYNANPTAGTATISITVVAKGALTYPTPNTYPAGTAIAALAPTNSGGTVSAAAISTTGTVVLTTASGLNKPVGMGVDPAGNVYVVNAVGNTVTEYTTTGTVSTFGSSANLSTPVGIVFDSFGNAYVLNQGTSNVVKYTGGTYQATIITGLSTPTGFAIDASNNLYVGNSGNNTISKYTTAGGTATLTFNSRSSSYPVSAGIAVDANGIIYVADNVGSGYVDTYSATGAYIQEFDVGTTIAALYVDAANNIYVTDTGSPAATVYTASFGSAIVNETGFTTPRGIVVDKKGNLFVSDFGAGTVTRYAPTGGYYLNGTLPTGLVFNSNNGNITGTPQIAYMGSYTVTPYNQAGAGTSNTFTITITSKPVITYTTPDTYNAGTPITPLTPTNTGSAATGYSAPSLPAGLSINPTTGVITGTPTTGTATGVNYVVTATNAYGSGTFTINITIIQAPAITYTPSTNNFPVNAAITPLTPANAGGPVTLSSFGSPVSFTGGTLNKPYGLAFDATGNVYVANYATATNNVLKYSSAGVYSSIYIARTSFPVKANPTGVGFDASGNAYVPELSGYLYKFASGGAYTSTITTAPNEMDAVWVDAGANVFIADNTDNAVYKYLPGGTTASLTIPASTHLAGPISVATDAAGNIYVLDNTNLDVLKYSSTGTYISTPVTGLSNPYGLYIDGSGNIFVADPGNGTVNEYDSTGALLASLTGLTNPRGVIADASGNIYVSDYTNNTLTKYSPTFSYAISAALPTGLSFNKYTGVISGTPTVSPSGPVTYTVTANGYGGTSATTPVTISVYTSYDWIGATADWQSTANWESKIIPTSSNAVSIGVNFPFTNTPVISSTGSGNAASVTFGNKGGTAGAAKLAGITINTGYSLTVAGAITKQSDVNSASAYISTLSGGGTVTAASLSVLPNLTATAAYADGISSTITGTAPTPGLSITGNVSLTSASSPQAATLSFNVTGGVTSVAGTLSTNNSASSTSTYKVINGTLQLANSAALSALSSNGTNVLSFANTGATIEYSGAAQTVYTDLPITGLAVGPIYQNIKFSGTGVKTPNGSATNNLNIAGDFTNAMANDGVNYPSLTGTAVQFNGNGAQSLNGGAGPTIAAGSPTITAPMPTGTVFNNVYFSNPANSVPSTKTIATGGFSVASTGILTMLGTGSYNVLAVSGGSLTLNSTANSSASVAPIALGGPSVTGNVNVQRFVTGGSGYRGYRLMSSPVYVNGTSSNKVYSINYPIGSIFLKGDVAGGGFDAVGNPNLYLYRDDITPSNATFTSGNYRGVNIINNSPAYVYSFDGETSNYDTYPGQGFLCFFRGDRYAAGQSLTTESVTTYVPTNTIITSTGVLIQQSVTTKWWHDPTKSLDYTAAPNNSATIGFNLVGNPYASTIDLNSVSTGGITISGSVETNFYELNTNAPYAQQFAIYNEANPSLSTNGATQYIASGQGFFAKTDAAGQTFTFNETAKVTTAASQPQSQSTLFMAEEHGHNAMIHRITGGKDVNLKYLRLTMAMDSTSAEDAVVAFKESSSAAYVINEDGLYRQGTGKVSLSSTSADNQVLAINMLPLVKKGTTIIPLKVSALADGTYSLNMTEFNNIPATDEVWLKDAKLSDSTAMKIGAAYSFAIALADTTTYGSKRFTLVIREDPKKTVHLLNFIADKVINGAKVIWKTDNEQNYTNFVVQRSIDNGKNFDDLNAFVSNAEGSYSFLDTHPVMPADNYRLKITDLSGNVSYSNIAPLQYSDLSNKISTNAITVYPNPAVGSINIAISQNFTSASFGVQIVSSSGVVMKKETSGTANWQSDVSKFLPGTYIIQVINNADKTVVGKGTFVKL